MSNMEAFNKISSDINKKLIKDLIDAIRDTQETKDEPVSLQCVVCNAIYEDKVFPKEQRTWVGLNETECGFLFKVGMTPFDYYQAIEAKLKEKNK